MFQACQDIGSLDVSSSARELVRLGMPKMWDGVGSWEFHVNDDVPSTRL
jgi:hypothetical protein